VVGLFHSATLDFWSNPHRIAKGFTNAVIDLHEWQGAVDLLSKPWLVLGKGPTFARRTDFDLTRFNLLALNDVIREVKVDVAHAIDVDVAARCEDHLRTNCRWLIMPRYPHVDFDPTSRRLEDFFDEYPVLREFDEQGRLVWYNLSSSRPVRGAPLITARFFSAEAALDLLGTVGVKHVRSLGIDGGRSYSEEFRDLTTITMLSNTRSSFDEQFEEIDRIVKRHSMEYAPLVERRSQEKLRIFVGADESQLVPAAILEYSIRKHSSQPVEFTTMIDLPVPQPKDPANRPRTGFSFYRFLIPALCGYEGTALYLDCDMQVFADIAELWKIPFDGSTVLCTYQPDPPAQWRGDANFKPGRHLAVMMLDCARLRWDIDEIVNGLDEGHYDYKELMSDLCIVPEEEIDERIPVEWNSLERYEPGRTKLLHYTVVPTQPWKNDDNPLSEIWMDIYRDAVATKFVDQKLVEDSIAGGHTKVSLLEPFGNSAVGAAPRRKKRVSLRATLGRARRGVRRRLHAVFR
jgi:hypothetical protein